MGRLSIFGLGGISSIDFLGDEIDENDLFANPSVDSYVESQLGLVGMKLVSSLSNSAYLKTSLGASTNQTNFKQDNHIKEDQETIAKYRATEVEDRETRYTLTSTLNKKFNARFSLRSGITTELYHIDALVRDRDNRIEIPG